MPKSYNPFTEQINAAYFVGREDQLKQFRHDLNGLKAKNPNHQFIAGLHGTGKTSYLDKMIELAKKKGFLAVMPVLDPEGLPRRHIATILRSIVVGIEERLKTAVPKIISDWDSGNDSKYFFFPRSDDVSSDIIRQDFETLARFASEAAIPGIVVCVDEGQRIAGRAMSALKNSLQHLGDFLIVLSVRITSDAGGIVAAGKEYLETKASTEAEGDIGAARFYVSGIPLGPFESAGEAALCIKKRLGGNEIQFDEDVVKLIGKISGFVPKGMISLANKIYVEAENAKVKIVNRELLNQTFRNVHREPVQLAESLISEATQGVRMAIGGLIQMGGSAEPLALACHIHPDLQSITQDQLADAVRANLDKANTSSRFFVKIDDCFEVPDPIHAYCLELALERI